MKTYPLQRKVQKQKQEQKQRERMNGFLLLETLLGMLITVLGASLCFQALKVFKQADNLQFYEIEKESENLEIVYETDWQAIEMQKEIQFSNKEANSAYDLQMAETEDSEDSEEFQDEDPGT